MPDRKGEIQVLFNGFHTDFWVPAPEKKLSDCILSVAYIDNQRNYCMKGVDDYINAARSMPELTFKLIGVGQGKLEKWEKALPENLQVSGSVSKDELLMEYQKAGVFCLLSLSEGMPNVLCEAMLCGCVPVVSDVNFNARLVGESGFVILEKNPSLIQKAINSAVRSNKEKGKLAREIILENYSFNRREEGLVKVIRDLSG